MANEGATASGATETAPIADSQASWALDAASLAVAVALGVSVAWRLTGPGRVLLALAFVAYVPGRAIVANWPSARARSQFAMPVVLSISIMTIISVVALWVHAWDVETQFAGEAAASGAALTFALAVRARTGSQSRAQPTTLRWP